MLCILKCVNTEKQSYALDSRAPSFSHFLTPSNSRQHLNGDARESCMLPKNQMHEIIAAKNDLWRVDGERTLFNHIRLVPRCLLLAAYGPIRAVAGPPLLWLRVNIFIKINKI